MAIIFGCVSVFLLCAHLANMTDKDEPWHTLAMLCGTTAIGYAVMLLAARFLPGS